jgi:ParB family chromosome partitioning protein
MAKLEDIQKAIEQRRLQSDVPAVAPRPSGSRAYVAQVADGLKISLIEQNKALKAERETGMVLLRLDPKLIGRTEFANRHDLSLSGDDPAFKQLKASIQQHGQDTPVRVRPSGPGGALPYELVEGHRRHAACLELDSERDGGFTVLARLDSAASDTRDLVLKMYRENAERADLSPYEYGRMFQSWLNGKVFANQSELARAVVLAQPTVSAYLAIANYPESLIHAFGDPRQIAMRWWQPLAAALKQDRTRVLTLADEIAALRPQLPAEDVFKRLIAPKASTKKPSSASHEESVKIKGKVAFRIARRDTRVAIKFARSIDRSAVKELAEKLKDVAEEFLKGRTP